MTDTPDPQTNPRSGRSRSSTLSGAFGPIQPNPPGRQQHHERRGSFLASLLGMATPFSAAPVSPTTYAPAPASTGVEYAAQEQQPRGKWSPASSVAETEETAPTSIESLAIGDGAADKRAPSLSASLGALSGVGSWGRAANWMAEKKDAAEGAPEGPIGGYTGGAPLSRRMSLGTPSFRRPFEMPSYASATSEEPDSFSPLSRVTSAPSAPEHRDGLAHDDQATSRGRSWWAAGKKTKRKLSPMGERMIRDSMFH